MRLFIGIELPDVLKNTVAAVASRVREDIARAAPDAQIRWVPATQPSHHGLVPRRSSRATSRAAGRLADAAARRPIVHVADRRRRRLSSIRCATSDLAGAGGWPRRAHRRARAARVADWCRLASHRRPVRIPRTLTIARVKEVRPRDARALRGPLGEVAADVGACEVECATLFVSRPTRTGAEYEPLSRVQLAR